MRAFVDRFEYLGGEKSRVGGKVPILSRGILGSEKGKVVDKLQCCRGKHVFPRSRDVKNPTTIRGRGFENSFVCEKALPKGESGLPCARRREAKEEQIFSIKSEQILSIYRYR